jgi:hypothetical protein
MTRPFSMHFPDPDSGELRSFGQALIRMMFAHAELELEILSLRDSIMGKFFSFRETLPEPRYRPHWIKKLIEKHAPGTPETGEICHLLSQAEQLCEDWNLLAHGHWWRFDPAGAGTITIRCDLSFNERKVSKQQDFTTDEVNRTASELSHITRELYRLRQPIEWRRQDERKPSSGSSILTHYGE